MSNIAISPNLSTVTTDVGSGINKWWRYEELAIPGVGQSMVNVGSGNLAIVASDVDIPEPGIDLAFHRVYNSQSKHDFAGDDGAEQAIYGERWTNNLDAHTVYNATLGVISVYDIDGTRYDYTADGNGNWTPPPGQHATLSPVSDTDCAYYWQKPSGTYYIFHAPAEDISGNGSCGITTGNVGRLSSIVGRNNNNTLTITPSYPSTGPKTAETVTKVVAMHSDGDYLVLRFGLLPSGQNELSTITLPDGNVISYLYDANGNLVEVDKPGNNMNANGATQTELTALNIPAGTLPEYYSYTATQIWVCGPRAILSNVADGSCMYHNFDTSNRVLYRYFNGVFNPTTTGSGDGVGGYIQPLNPSTGNTNANLQTFSGYGTGTTTFSDWFGHGTVWTINSNFSVSTTVETTGNATGPANLTTKTTWDGNNNLTSTQDARGQWTNYTYDTYGNTVEVQLPSVSTSLGTLRPTSYYTYDTTPTQNSDDVLSYCDPYYTATHSSITACPTAPGSASAPGPTVYQYNPLAYEPYGELYHIYSPLGYDRAIGYSAPNQGGTDLGLPTEVLGDPVTLPSGAAGQEDGTTRTPVQHFVYNATGDLTSYDQGTTATWTLSYDTTTTNMHRVQEIADPDGVASYKCYYPDGSIFYTESSLQHAANGFATNGPATCKTFTANLNTQPTAPAYADAYSYDTDGDESSEVRHFGQFTGGGAESLPAATTTKIYDGLDRLVEVAQPKDTVHDGTTHAWVTRYFYDFNTAGTPNAVTIGAVGNLNASGNLYKTVEYLPSPPTGLGTFTLTDVRGTSFDALDRPTAQYETANDSGLTPKVANVYDINGNQGLLDHSINGASPQQTTTYLYDATERTTNINFSDATPSRAYTYDPNGRAKTITSAAWGSSAYQNLYDAEGKLIQAIEPSGLANAGTMNYAYYNDGKRATLGANITGFRNFGNAFQYSYRVDGLLQTQQVALGAGGTYAWTYTPAGRESTQSDPSTGTTMTATSFITANGTNTYNMTFGNRTTKYDAYGQEHSLLTPTGYVLGNLTPTSTDPYYDLEGERLGWKTTPPTGPPGPALISMNNIFSSRGEFVAESPDPALTKWTLPGALLTLEQPPYSSAPVPCETGATSACTNITNGAGQMYLGFNSNSFEGMAGGTTVGAWDARTNQMTSMTLAGINNNTSGGGVAIYYDGAGRQTSKVDTNCMVYPPGGTTTVATGGTQARTYDAENHNISEAYTPQVVNAPGGTASCPNISSWAQNYTLQWGLTGHPWQINDNLSGTTTEHWDGDTILYEAGSGVLTFFVGKLGFIVQANQATSPVETVDRDWTGTAVQYHQNDAFSDYQFPGVKLANTAKGKLGALQIQWWPGSEGEDIAIAGKTTPGTFPADFQASFAGMVRPDGYQIEDLTVQGVRSYDPTSAQWTTPDAYAGDVHDPSSQKPFMWNGNNPVSYSDPSGFDTAPQVEPGPGPTPGPGQIQGPSCPIPTNQSIHLAIVRGEVDFSGVGIIPETGPLEKIIEISAARFGEAAEHIFDAQRAGQPATLTVDRAAATSNRAAARAGAMPAGAGKDLDEYPPAMFSEGGAGASVRAISSSSNRALGAHIGNVLRKVSNGTKVTIKVIH